MCKKCPLFERARVCTCDPHTKIYAASSRAWRFPLRHCDSATLTARITVVVTSNSVSRERDSETRVFRVRRDALCAAKKFSAQSTTFSACPNLSTLISPLIPRKANVLANNTNYLYALYAKYVTKNVHAAYELCYFNT